MDEEASLLCRQVIESMLGVPQKQLNIIIFLFEERVWFIMGRKELIDQFHNTHCLAGAITCLLCRGFRTGRLRTQAFLFVATLQY